MRDARPETPAETAGPPGEGAQDRVVVVTPEGMAVTGDRRTPTPTRPG